MNNIKNDSNEEININAINNKSFFFFFFFILESIPIFKSKKTNFLLNKKLL